MGAFYNSICLPGGEPAEIRHALERWLLGRGYRRSQEAVLFDLDGDSERSVFLVWNDRWTIVYFSHWDEERRLIRELQTEQFPLTYVWVYDSDVWGFDLFDAHGFVGSFSSDPKDHQSFADEMVPGEQRPPVDPAAMIELLNLDPQLASKITATMKKVSPFQEEICRELCALLEIEPAAASYDDLESGKLERVLEGWNKDQWVYFHYHRAVETIEGDLDLHGVEIDGAPPPGWEEQATQQVRLSPELQAEMEQMRRRARFMFFVVRPISWLARAWRRLYELSFLRLAPKPAPEPERRSPVSIERTATATRHEVRNFRHGVRILLPAGVEPLEVSGKPATVFSFRCGDTAVMCTARRLRHLWEVLRPPALSKVLRHEKYKVGPLLARHVLFELPPSRFAPGPDQRYLALHVVQTYRALYVFLYRFKGKIQPEVEELIRTAVSSFREDEPVPGAVRRRAPGLATR